MTRKIFITTLLGISLLLAIITRFFKLGEAPHGLYLDEAGQGYSAYSMLTTGKDEFGKTFPVVFRSFTDFKTPVYVYLIAPLIPIFGLTKFTVRFPSFFFSILTLPILYLLLTKITPKKYALGLSLLTALLLAISPWHILFGRTNFECNVALFFFLAGVYFFYRGLEKPKNLLLSAIFLAIAIPAYHAQRVVTPLMALLLFIRHRNVLLARTHKSYLLLGALIVFVLSLPTLLVATTPGFLARATGLNIFSLERQMPYGFMHEIQGALALIVNNRLFLSLKEFASLYVSYFSPRYMFILGDYGPRSSFPELATFFLWQFPFYLLGLYKLIKAKGVGELKFFTLTFLLIAPLPAAVTRDPYSSIRSLQMVIPQLVIIALGIITVWHMLKQHLLKYMAVLIFIVVILYSLAKLYSSVIILNEHYRARDWDYGWEEVANTIKTLDPNLSIVVDTARHGPYIELLFFLKYDPIKYQYNNFEVTTDDYYTNMVRRDSWDLGTIKIRAINWTTDSAIQQYIIGDFLAVSDDQIKFHNLKLVKEVTYPDGSVAFRIVETTPEQESAN